MTNQEVWDNKTISFVGDVEMDAWLSDYARQKDRSRSSVMREIVNEFRFRRRLTDPALKPSLVEESEG